MKALTLWQPWATLVAIHAKKLETRSWRTDYQGELAIHAAKAFPLEAQALFYRQPFRKYLEAAGYLTPEDLPRGAIVATCVLVRCLPILGASGFAGLVVIEGDLHVNVRVPPPEPELSFGDYSPGRFAWALGKVTRFVKPVPAKGAQGLWNWEPKGIET